MKYKARAKINLSLDVLGLRPDGYHEVLMVMQELELHDTLDVEESSPGRLLVECSDPGVPSGPDNLVFRAADLLRRESGCKRGASIYIHKNIPAAAGLAGGSADAAAALRALNCLWELNAGEKYLYRLAEMIGSDVPFCLMGKTARAAGRGVLLTRLPSFAGRGVVLVKPSFGVSTARVYTLYDTCPPGPRPDTDSLVRALGNGDFPSVAGRLGNVLERVTNTIHPEISQIKNALIAAGAAGALMSGSGSTVFGLCPDPGEAAEVASRLNLPDCWIAVTATV